MILSVNPQRSAFSRTTGRIPSMAGVTALAVALTVPLAPPARADRVPPVPANIEVPAGNREFLKGRGVGTQNYICLPSGSGFAWTLFTPQATLFAAPQATVLTAHDEQGTTDLVDPNASSVEPILAQVITHFFSPNPLEEGTVRVAWQHSRDTSTVWGRVNSSSADPIFVAPNAIPWLLVQAVGAQDGPTGVRSRPGVLTATTFIQRLNTAGGVAPSTGCSLSTDVGRKAFVPYTADYFFYASAYASAAGPSKTATATQSAFGECFIERSYGWDARNLSAHCAEAVPRHTLRLLPGELSEVFHAAPILGLGRGSVQLRCHQNGDGGWDEVEKHCIPRRLGGGGEQ